MKSATFSVLSLLLSLNACAGSTVDGGPGAGGGQIGGNNSGAGHTSVAGRGGVTNSAGTSSGGAGRANTGGSAGSITPAGGMAGAGKAGFGGASGGSGNNPGGMSAGGSPIPGGAGGTVSSGGAGVGGTMTAGSPSIGGRPSDACAPRNGYRNLFGELLMKSEAEVDAKLAAGYQSLFKGSGTNIYFETGSDEAYVQDINSGDVRTEGMSYGMTITVQMDKKAEFNRLWKWTKRVMAQSNGYFGWQATPQGQLRSTGPAPDGEEYFAIALIFAAKRWGDGSGIFAYSTEARNLLNALVNNGAFNRGNNLVNFLVGSNYTDPSYVLPAFYEVWACFDTRNQAFWKSAVSAGRAFFPKTCNGTTGLAPNFANYDGSPNNGSNFQSDAWRVVGNIMMDHHLFGADPWQTTFAAKYAAFMAKAMAMKPVPDEFNVNGNVIHSNNDPSKGLVAQNALVAFGVPADVGTPFVRALWDMEIPTGQYRYYDGVLYMLALLHASGRFRIY